MEAVIEKAMGYARTLDKALLRLHTPTLRAVFRDLLDLVEVFFRTERKGGRECPTFLRGFIYVRPNVLPDLSTAACRGPATCEPCCRLYTSSDQR